MPKLSVKECSVCKELKPYSEFYKDKRRPLGLTSECKKCHTKGTLRRHYRLKEENTKLMKKYLGGSFTCSKCGYTHETTIPFDWHHLNPTTKERTVSNMVGCHKWENILKEIEKCIFLCKNCHALEHFNTGGNL